MARVEIKVPRIQSSSFALYRTSAGGDESIIVRRKVGEPTDVQHTKSRKLKRQRDNFTLASQHYSTLSPSQKAITRHQIEEVEYQKSHGKTDTKPLVGRQLFISKEMHSLETTQKQLVLPHELCFMLVDENLLPLAGTLQLFYYAHAQWWDLKSDEIFLGNWLFSLVPKAQEAYRPYGQAYGYFDPQLPETQFMTEDEIRAYHYHVLLLSQESEIIEPSADGDLIQLGATGTPHWQMVLVEDTDFVPPNGGGYWGYWTGNFLVKTWFPFIELADLFHFTNPVYAAQHVNKITVHCKVGRDAYPYGKCRVILKTHGTIYYGQYVASFPALWWFDEDFTTNPHTGQEWTRDELNALQVGISMDKVGSFGALMCDKIYIEVHYI